MLGYGLSTRHEALAHELISRDVHSMAPRMYCILLMDCIYRHGDLRIGSLAMLPSKARVYWRVKVWNKHLLVHGAELPGSRK